MHSILSHNIIGHPVTMTGFTLMHKLVFEISFINKNDGNMNKSKTCVTGESFHSMLRRSGAQTKTFVMMEHHYLSLKNGLSMILILVESSLNNQLQK